ncbi:hypothetical protein C1H46_000305 [Malus baccata]|uniref:Uncharacterized protein n=1 Tax=Malus baccata TaxID=106549 RepID=A0A540NTM3_MALBA|nr:hypothetical protein C1H46_000305 [Malus baccata]
MWECRIFSNLLHSSSTTSPSSDSNFESPTPPPPPLELNNPQEPTHARPPPPLSLLDSLNSFISEIPPEA